MSLNKTSTLSIAIQQPSSRDLAVCQNSSSNLTGRMLQTKSVINHTYEFLPSGL